MNTDFLHGEYGERLMQKINEEGNMYRIELAELTNVTPDTIHDITKSSR